MTTRLFETLRALGRVFDAIVQLRGDRRLFLVGGAIRDVLMGGNPTDFDLAVSGSGIAFAQSVARKIHGKFVLLSEPDDEARVVCRESITLDFNGFADRTIQSDVLRRDFTVNALACEVLDGRVGDLLDLVGGQQDLKSRVIRPVADSSLAGDPLRLLRALRLALELGFRVHDSVYEQARTIALAGTAAERIGTELLRIMEQPGSYPSLRRLFDLGRLHDIMPELTPVLEDPQLREHTFRTYLKVEEIVQDRSFFSRFEPEWTRYFEQWGAEPETQTPEAGTATPEPEPTETVDAEQPAPFRRALLKLAGLFHDIAKPQTRFTNTSGEVHFYGHDSLGSHIVGQICRERLRLSRDQTTMLKTLVAEHMRLHLLATADDLTDRAIRRYFHDLGEEAFGLMILCVADGWATAGRTLHLEDTITRMINQQRAEAAKTRIRRLVTGDDLIELGMKPGPAFKVILQELEDLQIEGRIATKEEGIDYLKTHLTGLTSMTHGR